MVWICYCKVCQETVAWGNEPETLKAFKHLDTEHTEEIEINGKKVTKHIEHDCDVFEIPQLPDIPVKEQFIIEKDRLELKLLNNEIDMDVYIKEINKLENEKYVSMIYDIKDYIDKNYTDRMISIESDEHSRYKDTETGK